MSTEKKILANRNNSVKSTGPKTIHGKRYSSRNSLKHGYFSRQIPMSEADQADHDEVLSNLANELNPINTLQWDAVNQIANCMRRSALALRLETRSIDKLVGDDNGPDAEASGTSARPAAWYGLTPGDLQKARMWLRDVCADASENHVIREEWKAECDLLFGPRFYQILSQWEQMPRDHLLMAMMIASKNERFKFETPGFGGFKGSAEGVILDPLQNYQLKEKLLLFQLQHLEDLQRVRQQASQTAGGTLDFAPRFYASALRDLHRAIEWFWALKEREKTKEAGKEKK